MASYTTNLNLLKKDPVADASDTFNIQTMLNDNWDKIDAAMAAARSAEEYDEAGTYAVGDYCIYDGKLYKCVTAITAGEAWNAAHWVETSIGAELEAMLAHIGDKNNPHGVTPAQIGAVSTAELEAALAQPHKPGEIMMVATPVTDLPDKVLPCTGGFYDKSAFSELYGAIGAYAGVKFPAHSNTISNVYISYLKDGLVGYDRVRCETYVQAEVQSKTVYVLNENMELVRTITLPLAHHSSYQALSVYDGAVAYNHDGTSPDPDTFCVSLDGGITFYTYAMPSSFSSGVGMSKTKLYNFHNSSPCSMVIFDKLTKTFSTKSLTLLSSVSKFSFTNDDYCFLLYESNNSGIYTQTAQYVQDKINSSDITAPVQVSLSAKGSVFSYLTSYKGLLIGVYAVVNTGVSTATAGDVFWYDPARNKSGTFITMHPEKMYLNITSTKFWSENSEALYMLSYYTGNYYGVRITVNQKTGVGASASASVDATDSSLSSCKLAVVTENHVLRASCSSADYQNLCEISALNAQFCVPDIANIQGITAYIYTGEE